MYEKERFKYMRVKELNIKRNIRLFYISVLLYEMCRSSFYGFSSLFMVYSLKLKIHEISLIKMFNPIAIVLFEIPTGILADRFGRKINFILSNIISALGFIVYAYSQTFWHAVVGEVLYSIGVAFHTGSIDALLISQAKEDKSISISNMLSKSFFFRTLGMLIGGTLGILISYKDMRLPWIVNGLIFPLVALLATLIDGRNYKKRVKAPILKGIKNFIKNRNVIILISLSLGITLINVPFFNYWQIFMDRSLGVDRRGLSFIVIFIVYNALIALGGLSLPIFNRYLGKINTLSIFTQLVAIPSMLMVLTGSKILAIGSFMISEFARGVYNPSFNFVFNHFLLDEQRSLSLSQLSLFMRLFAIIAYLLSGFLAKISSNITTTIATLSSVGILITSLSIIALKSSIKRDINE